MFCTQCGKSVDQQDAFCRYCGYGLKGGIAPTPVLPQYDPRMRQIMENLDWHAGGGRARWILNGCALLFLVLMALLILPVFLGWLSRTFGH